MRRFAVLTAVLVAGGCAHLPRTPYAERTRLWEQAHHAYAVDSFRVAAAAFQRLAADYPRTHEGHEARFYLGALALEPRAGFDPAAAVEHLSLYVAADSTQRRYGYHQREARTLLRLATELRRPCTERTLPGLRCEQVLVAPGQPGEAAPTPPPAEGGGAEAARLRRELAERDQVIRNLRAELERIRNTLAPRRQPR